MKLVVDVHYESNKAYTAGICFDTWQDKEPHKVCNSILSDIKDYVPGLFYKRELPCILGLLNEAELAPELIIVDGHVFLDGHSKSGLGKYLYDSLNGEVSVIGVAKKVFLGMNDDYAVYRGDSSNPLYVTSIGINVSDAKRNIETMYGKHRIPVLLKKVDQLCRQMSQN